MSREAELTYLYVQYGTEIPLLFCSCTVNYCIFGQLRRRNPAFMTGFYVLYMLQVIVDLSEYATVSADGKIWRKRVHLFLPGCCLSSFSLRSSADATTILSGAKHRPHPGRISLLHAVLCPRSYSVQPLLCHRHGSEGHQSRTFLTVPNVPLRKLFA